MNWILLLIIGYLWWKGGGQNASMRDILIPILIGAVMLFDYPWWLCIITVGTCNIIRMGYGAYHPETDHTPSLLGAITKDRSGISERALYGLICGLISPLGLALWQSFTGKPEYMLHLLGYAFCFAILGALAVVIDKMVAWKRLPCDAIVATGFSLILWFF